MKTFDIDECANYLKVNKSTALELAAQGKIPGAKIGRAWVFFTDDVCAYLQEQVRIQHAQRQGFGMIDRTPAPTLIAEDRFQGIVARKAPGRKQRITQDLSKFII